MSQTLPTYIFEDLKMHITSGDYALHSFLPAERILSEQYNVDRSTLRKALALLCEEGYIQKIRGAGSKIIATNCPNANVPSSIVYALPDMHNEKIAQPYHMEICNYLEEYCKQHQLDLVFSKISDTQDTPTFLTAPNTVKGIIWVSSINPAFLEQARSLGIPSIVIANDYPYFPRINIADTECAYTATSHLIQKGCKRILHLTGIDDYTCTINRKEGYMRALFTHHLSFTQELLLSCDWNFISSYQAVLKFIHSHTPFDGIVAANDMMALGALKAVLESGLQVPHDVKIVGIDNIQQSLMITPSLTTLSVSQKDIALTAFMFLNRIMEGLDVPEEVLIPGVLIERETT